MGRLSPTTLTRSEQRTILAATRGNVRDHTIYSQREIVAFELGAHE